MKYKQKKTYLFRGLGDTFQHPQGCQWRSSSSACQQRSSGMFFWPREQLEWQFASAPGCCGTAELETTPSQAGACSVGSGWLVEMRGCAIMLCKGQEQGQGQGSFQKVGAILACGSPKQIPFYPRLPAIYDCFFSQLRIWIRVVTTRYVNTHISNNVKEHNASVKV